MKKIAVSILATVFGVGMLVALPTAAWAGTVCTGDPRTGYTCTVDDSGGGSPGGGGPIDGVNFTPGPTECIHKGTGDEEDQVVTWKGEGDISRVGEMAAIRVEMFQAKLFAYRL